MQRKLKTALCLLLCAVLALMLPVSSLGFALGDPDGDGEPTAADARLALRRAVGLETYAPGSAEFIACDVDGDNDVTAADARLILRAAVGLEDLKPATCQHDWKVERVTGSNKGYHNLKCSKCGETKKENCTYGTKRTPTVAGKPTEPTCTQDATYYVTCTKCEGKKITTEYKLNHAGKIKDASKSLAPDCTTAGYDFYSCPLCGKNGDTLAELKVTVPPLGHSASAAGFSSDQDIVCTRCHKVIMPSFNSLVNRINVNARPQILFSWLAKTTSSGDLEDYNIKISDAAQTLMRLMGETLDENTILEQFTAELDKKEDSYNNYRYQIPYLYQYYPLPYSNTVSALTADDVKNINIKVISNVDFMDEIPDEVTLQNGNATRTQDLADYKALGNAMSGNIYKVTVDLKEESYSKIKDSTEETALMHATGADIRTLRDSFTQNEIEDGFALKMECRDLTTNCSIVYYFLVEGEGPDAVYTPLASKYVTTFDINQHISVRAAMKVSELGIEDSGILNLFLKLTGLQQGDELVFMEGTIDLIVKDVGTDYYLFTISEE